MGGDWLLPEDGIVDEVAIEVAVAGLRPVRLTAREQAIALARMAAAGASPALIAARLRMNILVASRLRAAALRQGAVKAS